MERLIELYNIASPSGREKHMAKYIMAELKKLGVSCRKDKTGNIYAVKGHADTYPCVVSHIDEVHRNKTGNYGAYVVADEMVIGYDHRRKCQTGIGADDKNGIWICFRMLERFKKMKCVFFVGEETGCIGSSRADMDFFSDCRFVIQCDRRGNSDMVTQISGTPLCSKEFVRAVGPEKYGYTECAGLMTDAYTLKTRGLPVSCINLSCGYYNPHTDTENTILKDLMKCYRFVCHIIRTHRKVSEHRYERPRLEYCYPHGIFSIMDDWRYLNRRNRESKDQDECDS